MKKIINKIGKVLGLVLAAPIKLSGKALNIVRYLALGLGIIESVINEDDQRISEGEKDETGPEDKEGRLGEQALDMQRVNPAGKGAIDET
ncbi:hypothetical protein OHD16_25955 [Sphingobacterium sp. ML3W]|uniref:hypothetical protein n=1 Tax=Sphingobacterium sp. ML3W TaxID=1538644 RepID=UPI00249A92A3|nr:hypothetical protein [Sphingobacterium sp. ML3W]WFA78150.1 hypothetical protein OGI71_19095 [Sphingobacterium sp. ML3W]